MIRWTAHVSHLALYRKYRSQTFGDLVGQDHVVRTLQNSISSGRIAHSYLFTGPRGTGKTSTARLLAKALNCVQGPAPEPCNECEHCVSITRGNCLDVLEMDAASESGVEQVRDAIVRVVEYKPAVCRYKVFIIDEVHDLSGKAFDALLKTIEEPPDHAVFILATTEFNKVPPTIRSRCQKHEFHRATLADLVARLEHVAQAEGVAVERTALLAIARLADGGYRDALTLLEQAIVTSDGAVTLEGVYAQLGLVSEDAVDSLLESIGKGDARAIVETLEGIYRSGRDPRAVLDSMLYRLSDLARTSLGIDAGFDAAAEAVLHDLAVRLGAERLMGYRLAVAEMQGEVREVSLPRLWLEARLVGLALHQVAAQPTAAPARPASAPAQPATHAAPKAATPSPSPVPSAQAPSAVPAAPESHAPPAPTGDADLDRARAAWHRVVVRLSEMSKTAKLHVAKTEVESLVDGRARIAFERKMDADWVQDRPKVQAAIQEAWAQEIGAAGWRLDYGVQPTANHLPTQEPAVELPSEGAKLEQLGKDVFEGA